MSRCHALLLLLVPMAFVGCNRENPAIRQTEKGFEGTWNIVTRDSGKGPEGAAGFPDDHNPGAHYLTNTVGKHEGHG